MEMCSLVYWITCRCS